MLWVQAAAVRQGQWSSAKNDPLDARMIASFIATDHAEHVRRSLTPAVERLAEILTVRRQLSDAKSLPEAARDCWKMRRCQRLRRRIARLAADIDLLDGHLVEIVAADAALVHRYRLLTSMLGRPVLLHADRALPELGRMNRKQVAALVGRRPTPSTAASSKESLHLGRSRSIRRVLYMAALVSPCVAICVFSFPQSPRGHRKEAEGRHRGGDVR